MNIFWKVRMKFLFHMKVNKPSAIISKRVFDLHILNQWNGRIKVPVFFYGHLTRLNSKGFEDGKTVAQTQNGNCS